MKIRNIIFPFLLLFTQSFVGQEVTTVTAIEDNVGKENGLGFKTRINRAEEKVIIKEWKSLLKGYNGKVVVEGTIISAEEVQIESMGSDPLIVRAEIRNVNKTEHDFFVQFYKNGQYVNDVTDLSAFTAAKTIVRMFSNRLSEEATDGYQKVQLKLYDNLTSEMNKLKKEKEKAEKLIKNAEEEIKAAQQLIKDKTKEIAENKEKQAVKEEEIEKQKIIVKKANAEAKLYK